MKDLKGKTAFITGGASGIGLGIAKAFAKEGMNIVIADIRQKAIDEALPIFKENGWPAHGIQLDVTDREAYERAADEAEAKFGKIHVLVNNAGLGVPEGPVWNVSYKDVDLMVDVNLKGVLNGIMVMVPRIMKHGEGGHIVSTASKAGLIPVPGFTLYNSTKRAVIAIMETSPRTLQAKISAPAFFVPVRSRAIWACQRPKSAHKCWEKNCRRLQRRPHGKKGRLRRLRLILANLSGLPKRPASGSCAA